MSIFEHRFTTGQVVAAAGVTNASLQSWIRRGVIVGQKDGGIDMPGSPGIRRTFSFYNVMEIAVAKALIDNGMDVSAAFRAAMTFSHLGDEDRQPALPYPGTEITLLCAGGGRSDVVAWKHGDDVLVDIRWRLLRSTAFSIVVVNDVFDRVCQALGFHPEAVLEAEYGNNQ